MIQDIINEINNTDEIIGHSEFQIRNFIINQPTDYGKYKQCVLELKHRCKTHKNIKEEIERISLIQEKSKKEIELLSEYQILIKDLEREMEIFYSIFNEIKQYIDFSQRDKLEEEYWNTKFEKELLSYIVSGHSVPPSLIQSIWSLPKDNPVLIQLNNFLRVVDDRKNDNRTKKIEGIYTR